MSYLLGAYGAFFILIGIYAVALVVRHRRLKQQGI